MELSDAFANLRVPKPSHHPRSSRQAGLTQELPVVNAKRRRAVGSEIVPV